MAKKKKNKKVKEIKGQLGKKRCKPGFVHEGVITKSS